DLVGVKLVLRRQFRNRPLAADRFKRDLGLELGRKPSACLHAGLSFSSENPPYAPVSETGATSLCHVMGYRPRTYQAHVTNENAVELEPSNYRDFGDRSVAMRSRAT